jgi:5-hydroxyisourate hydrolase-like protein (transthyretin family)
MNLTKNAAPSDLVPSEFYLSQNYPNPFCRKTAIKFCVAYKAKVMLQVFNSEGKMIKILLEEEKEAGTYEVEFSSCGLSEGVYVYQLQVGDYLSTKKMLVIK